VLERQHTLSSDLLGYDSYGHAQFDTRRNHLRELVFRLASRRRPLEIARVLVGASVARPTTRVWKSA